MEYLAQYRDRVDELVKCQQELWKIHNDDNTKRPVKIMALSKIMDATIKLTELYDALPVVASIKYYDMQEEAAEHPVVRALRDRDLSFRDISPCRTRLPLYDNDDQNKLNTGFSDSDSDSNNDGVVT
jgi:hypothetical protein